MKPDDLKSWATWKGERLLIVCLLLSSLVGASLVFAPLVLARDSSQAARIAVPRARPLSQGPKREKKRVLLVSLYPEGFLPSSVEITKEPFLLAFNDRSGLDQVAIRLNKVAGPQLKEVKVRREVMHWSEVLDLTPGDYLLTVDDHPEWQCQIRIKSH